MFNSCQQLSRTQQPACPATVHQAVAHRQPTARGPRKQGLFALAALAAAFFFDAPAQQAKAQAVPTATGPGPYISIGGTVAAFESSYGQRVVGGASIYLDLHPHKTYGVEIEAKTFRMHQEADVRQSTLLAGPRISFGSGRLTPFAKVLVGMGRFEYPYHYATGNYFVIAPGAGVDFALNRRLKVRLLQVEYQTWPQFTFGSYNAYGVSTGLSLRIF
ncbi:MAG: hypothetical protein JWM43_2807 [Acidobacteriaceae bacterium]|nr:hypothetical protein [Acidobacteriaceae bacterium]